MAKARSIDLVWHELETRYNNETEIPTVSMNHSWTEAVVGSSVDPLGLYLPIEGGPAMECDHSLAILHVAKVGRSYALPKGGAYEQQKERAVLFLRRVEIWQYGEDESVAWLRLPERPASFVHEVLHLFGAEDLYKPEARARKALTLYPNDVMLRCNRALEFIEIAGHTAYGIGWEKRQPTALPVSVEPRWYR